MSLGWLSLLRNHKQLGLCHVTYLLPKWDNGVTDWVWNEFVEKTVLTYRLTLVKFLRIILLIYISTIHIAIVGCRYIDIYTRFVSMSINNGYIYIKLYRCSISIGKSIFDTSRMSIYRYVFITVRFTASVQCSF